MDQTPEDYIKAVYRLERRGKKVTTSALADHLQLADASITGMIKKLSDRGLIHYQRYRGVELTTKGRRIALQIVRRHRLWEMYLVRFLGFSWDKVHDEAERLEHVTSEEMEHHLDEALGFPDVDPHGHPIPSRDGTVAGTDHPSLAECEVGDIVRVLRVSDDDSTFLQHATSIGLALNSRLVVKEKKEFDGSMVVKVGARDQFISREVAEAIFVKEA